MTDKNIVITKMIASIEIDREEHTWRDKIQTYRTYGTYERMERIIDGIISIRMKDGSDSCCPNPKNRSKVVKNRLLIIFRECVWVLKYVN